MIKDISQDALLIYPPEKFKYIIINFVIDKYKPIPIKYSEKDEYDKIYKSYFIFRQINWFYKNEIRRKSDFFSKDTFKNEFSYFLFKKEIIDQLLLGIVDENNEFIDLSISDEKNKVDLNILDHAVTKYIETFSSQSVLNIDLEELSKDTHKYFRYNIKSEAGKAAGFIKPQAPSPVILKSLIEQFSGMTIEELINMDENILQMLQVVGEQQQMSNWEKQHINEKIVGGSRQPTVAQQSQPQNFLPPQNFENMFSKHSVSNTGKQPRKRVPFSDSKTTR